MENTLKSIPVVRLFHLCEVEGYAKEFKRQFTEATDTMIEKIKERGILTNLQFSSIAKCQYLVDTFVKSTLFKDFKSKQRDKFENELVKCGDYDKNLKNLKLYNTWRTFMSFLNTERVDSACQYLEQKEVKFDFIPYKFKQLSLTNNEKIGMRIILEDLNVLDGRCDLLDLYVSKECEHKSMC